MIAVAHGVGQAFEHDHAAALAAAVAVRGIVEHAALIAVREHVGLGGPEMAERDMNGVHPAAQGYVALSAAQTRHGQVHAVSTLMLGPRQPRKYDTRPDAALCAMPVPTYAMSA